MPLTALLGRMILGAFGWKTVGGPPAHGKYVLVAAPHTSGWDFPFTVATFWKHGVKLHWIGKHTLFKPPFGGFFRALGGIAVDRRAPQNLVQTLAQRFAESERLVVAVPVEGTRKRQEYWKSGFYHIARAAGVPVVLGALDFVKKEATLGPAIFLTGDMKADMDKIRAFYADKVGKHPEWFGPVRLRDEEGGASE
jgi:1-acyl-sn-glycerol-3-phosphate acyltransferase